MGKSPAWLALLGANFLARLSYELVRSPVLPLFVVALGGSPVWVGVLVATAGLVGTATRFYGGILADRWGARALLVGGGALFGAVPLGYLVVAQLPALLVVRVGHALAPSAFSPASAAFAANTKPHRAAEGLAWVTSVKAAASVLGGVLGGWLLAARGFGSVFWLAAALGALVPLLAWGLPADKRDCVVSFPPPLAALLDGSQWRLALGGMLAMAVQAAYYGFVPVYGEAQGWPKLGLGALVALHFAALAAVAPFVGKLADRRGAASALAGGLGGGALGFAAFAIFPSPLTAGLAALGAAGAAGSGGPATALAMLRSSRHGAGTTMGLWATALDLGEAGGGLITGLLAGQVGVPGSFLAWTLALAAGGVIAQGTLVRTHRL